MKTFSEQLQDLKVAGYRLAEAEAKVAHDAVLFAMHKSGFKDKATVNNAVNIRVVKAMAIMAMTFLFFAAIMVL